MPAGKENESWRNHYTPQFYLQRWTSGDDGKLWQTQRLPVVRTIESKRVLPKSTSFKAHLYRTESAGPSFPADQPDVIEKKFFGPLDNEAALALAKLVDHGVDSLNAEERRVWATFINSLLERHPTVLDERDEIARACAEQVRRDAFTRFATNDASRSRLERAFTFIDLK